MPTVRDPERGDRRAAWITIAAIIVIAAAIIGIYATLGGAPASGP